MTIKPKPALSITNTEMIYQATWLASGTNIAPERLIEKLAQSKLRSLYEIELMKVKTAYLTGNMNEKEYFESVGEKPTSWMVQKAKENHLRKAKARFVCGELSARAYKKETGEAPSEELKERAKQVNHLNSNIALFAAQGTHCYTPDKVEKLFKATMLKNSKKNPEPLTKEFDL